MIRRIAGLREIAGDVDAVLLDQFGVLHDGRRAFDGVMDCLAALRTADKRLAVVSNSGKRAAENVARLARLGFAPDVFDAVLTSGELAHAWLAAALAEGRLTPGARVLVLSRDGDRSALEELDLTPCDAGNAALVLIAGVEPESITQTAYADRLAPLARAGVPCLCANPDRTMYVAGGTAFAAGVVAEDYAAAGGSVTWLGKPHKPIFAAAVSALGTKPARTLMVGDSAEHDLAGAAAAGLPWLHVEAGAQAGPVDPALGPGLAIDRLRW